MGAISQCGHIGRSISSSQTLDNSQKTGQKSEYFQLSEIVEIFSKKTNLNNPKDIIKLDRLHKQKYRSKSSYDSQNDLLREQYQKNTENKIFRTSTQNIAREKEKNDENVNSSCNLQIEKYIMQPIQHQTTIDKTKQSKHHMIMSNKTYDQVNEKQSDYKSTRWVHGQPKMSDQLCIFEHSTGYVYWSLFFTKLININQTNNELLGIILYQVYIQRNTTEMDNLLRQKILQLTSKCDILQKNGKFAQCIDIMEEIVSIKKNIYGIEHPQFDKSSQKLCQYLNLAAMVQLQKQQFDATIDHLRKAQLVARNSIPLKSTTYNNMACYYRRTGKVRTALSYLIQALDLQLKIDQPKTLADTHLNLCAVLSQLDRHQDALQHSMLSIILLQDQFLTSLLSKYKQGEEGGGEEQINDQRLAVLAIAYHNLGVQFEHLKRFEEALKIYKKALKFSKDNLSNNEQLVKNLTRVVNSATQQIQQQKKTILLENQKSGKLQKGLSQDKKNIYKQLSKTVQRYRHLPKLKFNSKQHSSLLASYDPNTIQPTLNKNREGNQFNSQAGKTSRSNQKGLGHKFGNTRYRLGMGVAETPSSRAQMDSQLKIRQGMGTRTNKDNMQGGG